MGKVNTSNSYLKTAREQSQPYQDRASYKEKLRGSKANIQYKPSISVKIAVQSQQEENKTIKTIRDRHSQKLDLDYYFERSFSYQDRKYPSKFSQESVDRLEKAHETFVDVMFSNRERLTDILTKNINEVKDDHDSINLLLELSLIANIIKSKTNITNFISKFRTFINDTLHLTKEISWFNPIKELLIKEADSTNNIVTVNHIYQIIYRVNRVANQQETPLENNLSLDPNIQTAASEEEIKEAIENYPVTKDFISQATPTMEEYDVQMTSKEIAAYITNKPFNQLNTGEQKVIVKELAFFLADSQNKVEYPNYLVQFYLYLLCRIIISEKLDNKSLDEICNGTSKFFSELNLEVTSQQLQSVLCYYADPKKNKHIDIERVVIDNVLEAMFADKPL
jgi:hypothetical protein